MGQPKVHRHLFSAAVLSQQSVAGNAFRCSPSLSSAIQKRSYAATPDSESKAAKPETDEEKDAAAAAEEKSMLRRFYGITTVVSTAAIGYGSWWMINNAMKMVGAVYASPHIVAYAGFWFGFVTNTVLAALAIGVYRLSFIRPEGAFGDTFKMVRNNAEVKKALGNTIKDGKLKSYEIKGGRFTTSGALPKWLPHQLQMTYIVYGEKGAGLVTTVVEKKPSLIPRQLEPHLLAVDMLDEDDTIKKGVDTLLLVGDKSQLEVRDNIRRLLKLKVGQK